ncbi:MAG: histidinol phosphate phosphatase domain-containing protein [Thermoplasmata archaeon]|nr:histidinol phosphate phosphatase domain-containing protein [Thermoplasmata archaeon]
MTEPTRRRFDFHSHTFLSDGDASATDMWAAADRLGHRVLAVTDHVALNDPSPVLERLRAESRAFADGPLLPFIGVEISMVPPRHIDGVAKAARRAGAEIVIVHGETLAEPVPLGTNRAAIECREVDLLAHPGLLDAADAELAHAHGTFLELSGRNGHSISNGHVARTALAAGASVVVDSDAHATRELLPIERAERVALGAGLVAADVARALDEAPRALVRKLGRTL